MPKFKLTLTATIEYEAVPVDYGTDDPTEMLQIDIDNVTNDPFIIFDGAQFMVTGEILPSE